MPPEEYQMRIRTPLLCSVLILGSFTASALSSEESKVRSELQRRYADVTRPFKKRDLKSLMATLAPDYTVKQPNGQTMTREQVEQDFKRQMEGFTCRRW